MKGRALRCIADNAFDASGWWPVAHRCQASGIRAFAARCAELLLQLAFHSARTSQVTVLRCVQVRRAKQKHIKCDMRRQRRGGCRLFTARWAPCKGFCSTTLPERRTHFTSWSRPSLHLSCLQGTASQWWALLLPPLLVTSWTTALPACLMPV